jgi:hypothetical protein
MANNGFKTIDDLDLGTLVDNGLGEFGIVDKINGRKYYKFAGYYDDIVNLLDLDPDESITVSDFDEPDFFLNWNKNTIDNQKPVDILINRDKNKIGESK